MRLQIKSKNFELTPDLTKFIENKMDSLSKFLDHWDKENAAVLDVEVSRTTQHHNKGNIFYAEANLQLPGSPLLRIEETSEDMYAAVDRLKDRLKKDILRLKDKLADH